MLHPFGGILNQEGKKQTRRDALKKVMQVSAVVAGAGIVGTASASTRMLGEEGGKPPSVKPDVPKSSTLAGPAHPEHAGKKVHNMMADLAKGTAQIREGDWFGASESLTKVRKIVKPKEDEHGHHDRLQKRRESVEETLKQAITNVLDGADKQAKADNLVPALKVYRVAKKLDAHYGFKKRVKKSLADIAQHRDYAIALKKVEEFEAIKDAPQPEGPRATSAMIGEEGGDKPRASTRARGEEGGKRPKSVTTAKIGEEGGDKPRASTRARGEEGGKRPKPVTTAMIGEEGGDKPRASTRVGGEEGGR